MIDAIETYGYEMHGLEEAAETTETYDGSDFFVEIRYNRRTGQIYSTPMCGSSYTVSDDPDVIPVRNATWAMTEQEIADAILDAIVRDDMDRQLREQQQAMDECEAKRELVLDP